MKSKNVFFLSVLAPLGNICHTRVYNESSSQHALRQMTMFSDSSGWRGFRGGQRKPFDWVQGCCYPPLCHLVTRGQYHLCLCWASSVSSIGTVYVIPIPPWLIKCHHGKRGYQRYLGGLSRVQLLRCICVCLIVRECLYRLGVKAVHI